MMSTFTALFDACVLYPAPLRDLLMRLAQTDLFRPRWTEQIHDEWIRNVLQNRSDLTTEQLQRTRTLMNSHVRDCLVTGYEPLIDGLTLPDPDDRHVLAAAIRTRASVIVTCNLKDFPQEVLGPLGLEAQHPDDFITHLIDLNPGAVCAAAKQQRASLGKPPYTVDEFLETLARQQLPKTVSHLRGLASLI
jgi:predicted nucleic acid-binding protein